jgi:signal transduction histidine kinase
MEAAHRQTPRHSDPGSAPTSAPEASPEAMTAALAFLFAIRWGAWAIALVLVAFGDLPDQNTHHEPLLLWLTAFQVLAATLYVPILRPRVRKAIGRHWGPNDDVIVLGLVDVAAVLAVLYFSGGWRTPYYHYAVASLMVPAFLLGWRRTGLLLAGFFAAYFAVLATAGQGTDGPWLHEDRSSLAGILITPLLVAVVVRYLSSLTRRLSEQREQARRALEENVRLQKEREELAALEERSRIAREIHDGIAQSIYMLSLNLEKAADVASEDQKLGPRLKGLVALAKEALLEVRHYIFDLKPLLSGDAGLTSTIQGQIREFSTVSGLPVKLRVEGEEWRVPIAVGSSLYRIAQEALANVYRHADASAIDVHLTFCSDSVSLEIRDNGRGFAVDSVRPASSGGRGLGNMYQRTSEVGGQLNVTSVPGKGTTVRVTVPMRARGSA